MSMQAPVAEWHVPPKWVCARGHVCMRGCMCERVCESPHPPWMDGCVPICTGMASLESKLGGGSVGCKLPWVAYKPSYVVAWSRHGACHACPLGYFINQYPGDTVHCR